MSQSSAFLEALFAGKPEDLFVLLWTLPEKRSHWCRNIQDATQLAESLSDHDLYVGLGLSVQDYGPARRCSSNEVAGIVGLWADLDLRSEAHPKAALPASIEDAMKILPLELPPTFIVRTGNGAHVWWLFREPLILESDEDRREAGNLALRWQSLLRDNAAERGWAFDRLADLARVLRIPGTTNCKDPVNPKPVEIQVQTGHRYNPSDFAEYLDELGVPEDEVEALALREFSELFKERPLKINLAARIPEELLRRWLETDIRFKNTWFRQRADLHDQSQSGYDLALACFGFQVGLEEQQIVDLLIHHRSLHKQKPRTRLDYFRRTLAKASTCGASSPDRPELPGVPEAPPSPTEAGADDPNTTKINLCRKISSVLGVNVLRLVKLTGKEPFFVMELEDGKIEIPGIGSLLQQKFVRESIAARVGKLIPRIKAKLWEELAQMMLDACLVEDGGEELEAAGNARIQLAAYLADNALIPSIEGQIAQNQRKPIMRDGRIAVCASDVQVYLSKSVQQSISVKAVVIMLVAIGAKLIRVRGTKFKEQSRWLLPLSEFDPMDYSTPEEGGTHDVNG